MSFTAKDVQTLRQATGAGMMDAKRALEANDGDMESAAQWLREKGLGKAAEIQSIEVWWPATRTRQTFAHVARNQFIEIKIVMPPTIIKMKSSL
jgi:phosphohistidine phosphatase SixA